MHFIEFCCVHYERAMTSIPDQTPSLEHILGRAFFTAAQIILSSRILPQPSRLDPTSRTTSNKPTSHWVSTHP